MIPKILGPFDASKRVYIDCSKDIPLTKQEFKEECDINHIIKRAIDTGDTAAFQKQDGALYGDVTNIPSFEEMENSIIEAYNQFDLLNPKIKDRFENNPGKLLAFLQDTENRDEGIKLGLLNKPSEQPAEPAKPAP